MKISNPLIAMTAVALLPLAAMAGDKDKTAPMGTPNAQFDKLDTNRDGRISQSEASTDPRLVFSTVDQNGDGYLDNSEYLQRDMSHEQIPNTEDPTANKAKPRQ